MKLDNTVIQVKNRRHGKQVIKFFKDQDCPIPEKYSWSSYTFSNVLEGDVFTYYGFHNGRFDNFSLGYVEKYGLIVTDISIRSVNEPELSVIL
jgi:hypothetical protein